MNAPDPPVESTRDALLDAAEQVFAAKGFAGGSVRDITTMAQANLGAVTYHFGSKAALYEAVIARGQEAMLERVQTAAWGAGTALDRVESVVRAHFEFLADHPSLRRLLIHVLLSDAGIPEAAAARLRRAMGLIATLVARGQSEGGIRAGDPLQLTIAVMAQPLMLNLLRDALRTGPQIDLGDPGVRAEMIDSAVRFIRAGLGRPQGKEEA
ncbi:MAG TPA: TetR/AcrR family transcriptional regulator [Gemmatimonadales bacterium]